jgi:hypothetical protein
MTARLVGRPVKLVLRREQMYGPVGHRPPTRQTLRDGALTAIGRHTKTASSAFDDFFEPASNISHKLYASPAIGTSHEAVRLDTGTPLFMRAPGEATGSIALESAMDEMAQACGMGSLAFRLKNYAEVEPISGKPFSSKALRDCYDDPILSHDLLCRPCRGTTDFPAAPIRNRTLSDLAPRRRHMPRQRRASAGPDLEVVAVRLAADRKPDRLHRGGIATIAAQHPLEIDRIRLPEARVQHA